jgi:hypothetical protein
VNLIHPHNRVGAQPDRLREPLPVGRDGGRIVADVVTEIELVERRLGDAAGAGGGHAPNPNTHIPSIRAHPLVPHERRDVDVVVVIPTDADRRAVGVHRHAGSVDRLEQRRADLRRLAGGDRLSRGRPTGLRLGPVASKPAAITVTRTSSPSESSITVPKDDVGLGHARSCTSEAASLISNKPRSLPPGMDISTPCAPSMDASSSGELIAISAASASDRRHERSRSHQRRCPHRT